MIPKYISTGELSVRETVAANSSGRLSVFHVKTGVEASGATIGSIVDREITGRAIDAPVSARTGAIPNANAADRRIT